MTCMLWYDKQPKQNSVRKVYSHCIIGDRIDATAEAIYAITSVLH